MTTTNVPHTPGRTAWNRGWAAVARGTVAVFALLGHAGRAEDDRIVDDAQLAMLESGQAAQMMHDGNVQDLQTVFESNVFGSLGQVVVENGGRVQQLVMRGGHKVVIRGGAAGQVVIQGANPAQAGRPEEAAETEIFLILCKAVEPQLARLEQACRPSAEQRRLLQLALDADVRRVAEEIDRERRKYIGVKVTLADKAGQQKWQQFHQDIQRCRQTLQSLDRNPHGLFTKVQSTVLAGEQYTRFTAETEARTAYRWKALVAVALSRWEEVLCLDRKQHAELEKLLLEKRPALRANSGLLGGSWQVQQMQQAQWLVGLALAEAGEQRVRQVVNERQWNVLSRTANQARQMRGHLEQTGLLEPAAP